MVHLPSHSVESGYRPQDPGERLGEAVSMRINLDAACGVDAGLEEQPLKLVEKVPEKLS